MNRSDLQRLLKQDEPVPADCLPDNFAGEVLSKGKLLRRLVWQHWRWLSAASIVSLLIAIALGLGLVRFDSEDSGPPLRLFQSNVDAAPFSTK